MLCIPSAFGANVILYSALSDTSNVDTDVEEPAAISPGLPQATGLSSLEISTWPNVPEEPLTS